MACGAGRSGRERAPGNHSVYDVASMTEPLRTRVLKRDRWDPQSLCTSSYCRTWAGGFLRLPVTQFPQLQMGMTIVLRHMAVCEVQMH